MMKHDLGNELQMVNDEQILRFYEDMVRVMLWDQWALRLQQEGKVLAGYHSGRGQEAIPVGAISPLRDDDYIMYTHRGCGYTIQKGMSMVEMFGDLMGNTAGSTRGLGAGIPHFADLELGILGQGGTLGTCSRPPGTMFGHNTACFFRMTMGPLTPRSTCNASICECHQ